MNLEIIASIYKYVEVLFENNQRLIKIFGIDAANAMKSGTKDILDLVQDIPRLIPYYYSKKDAKICVSENDGLLEYVDELPYLKSDFESIINNYEKLLDKVRKIRNKYEHVLHNIKPHSCYKSNKGWFEYGFESAGEKCQIGSEELVPLFKDLNIIYNKLIIEVLDYLHALQDKDEIIYHYRNFSLLDFNKLYDSDLMFEIGKAMAGIHIL